MIQVGADMTDAEFNSACRTLFLRSRVEGIRPACPFRQEGGGEMKPDEFKEFERTWTPVVEAVIRERNRQLKKWGRQNQHSLETYLTILVEEVGELAASILRHRFGNEQHPELDWQKEAIQVATVAMAMVQEKGKL